MRLIDAEHLKWNVGGIECGEITIDYLLWVIDNQEPTIEAIPVEWIEEWYRNKADKPFVADDVSVRLLLRDWREEHETD